MKRFRLPRWAQIARNLLLIAGLLLLIYTFLGAPASFAREYRRAEQAHLVGPGEILGVIPLEGDLGSYRQLQIAETEEGVILYAFDHPAYNPPKLVYRPKTGDMTMVCAPYPNESREEQTVADLPVLLFHQVEGAASARMKLQLTAGYRGETFHKAYQLKAQESLPGCFVFRINTRNPFGLGLEGTALQRLALLSGYHSGTYSDMVIPALVWIYDENGQLLEERTVELTSVPQMTQEAVEAGG